MSAAGIWNITTNSPMGSQQGTLNLTDDGGSLSGTMSGPQGDIPFSDGTVDGDNLAWQAEITSPMAIKLDVTAEIKGDEISGSIQLGAFGTATFSGSRA